MAKAGDLPQRIRQVGLRFQHHAHLEHVDDPVHEDLSACVRVGDTLFVASDESAGLDRLVRTEKGRWEHDEHFNLGAFFDLPDGDTGEMDIEGLDADGGLLWITGSHSLKRDTPDDGDDPVEALAAFRDIDRDPNRYFLGCVPLAESAPGIWQPVAEANGHAACAVKLKKKNSKLLDWLEDDELIAPFLSLPSKENGFDIEGLTALGRRLWLGLRGPAIRGHAVVLELELKAKNGHLKARRIDGKRRYRKYLVPTEGLGVRDLLLDGDDLLLLVGPTMASDGPARVLRWRDAVRDSTPSLVRADRLQLACELPYHGHHDHPEGLARWPDDGEHAFMVVYDAPSPERLKKKAREVLADIVRLDPG